VIGGGDVACEEAIFLSHFGSKVIMLIRRNVLRASKILQEKIFAHPKIEIMRNTEAMECFGDEVLQGVKIKNNQTNEESDLGCKGLFYAIGHTPNTAFLGGQIMLDEDGYIITSPGGKTNIL
jgi:thioredoxin reductase (NADPH)